MDFEAQLGQFFFTMDTAFLYRLGRANINIVNMLRDRGYIIENAFTDPYELAGHYYVKASNEKTSLAEAAKRVYRHKDGHYTSVWCLDRNYDIAKCRERMVSTDQIKAVNDLIESCDDAQCHIILSPNKLSPQAKKEALQGELFLFDDLMVDLPRHELVVPHTIVTEEAVKKVLGQTLRVDDLPRLSITDPIARWYGFKRGSIVYIDNPSIKTFRIVS